MAILWPLTAQKSGITIFSDESTWRAWIAYRETLVPTWQSTLGSRYAYWLGVMASNFGQSFTPQFLVTQGGTHPWHSLPNWGHLYLSIYLFSWVGLVSTLKTVIVWIFRAFKRQPTTLKEVPRELILFYLLIISLLPSIITVDSPHTTRSLFFIFLMSLLAIKGVDQVVAWSKLWRRERAVRWLITSVILLESSWYFYQYFGYYPHQQPGSLKAGFDQVIQAVEQRYPQAQVAVIDDEGFHYILAAWYLKLPADQYFSHNVRQLPDKIGFRYGERVTHYHFIAQEADRSEEETIVINWTGEKWEVTTY